MVDVEDGWKMVDRQKDQNDQKTDRHNEWLTFRQIAREVPVNRQINITTRTRT